MSALKIRRKRGETHHSPELVAGGGLRALYTTGISAVPDDTLVREEIEIKVVHRPNEPQYPMKDQRPHPN